MVVVLSIWTSARVQESWTWGRCFGYLRHVSKQPSRIRLPGMSRDVRDVKRCQEMSRDVKRCQEMSRDVKRCQEMSRDVKRCQEMSRVKSNYWKPPEPQNQWSGSESVTSWSSCALRECLEWSSLAAALLLQQCWCLWIWYTWQIDAKQVYELYNREKRHIWTTPLFFWTDIAGSEFCGEKQTRAPSQNLPRCWQRSPWFQRRLKKPSCSL